MAAVSAVDTIADLRSETVPASAEVRFVDGYDTVGDGGGGAFIYDAASTASDNGGNVIRPTSVAEEDPGRWIWPEITAPINARRFGLSEAAGKETQNVAALNAALAAEIGPVRIPAGAYRTNASINLPSEGVLLGDGPHTLLHGSGINGDPIILGADEGQNQRVGDMAIMGRNAYDDAPAIRLRRPRYAHLHDLYIGVRGRGIECYGFHGSSMDRIYIAPAWLYTRYGGRASISTSAMQDTGIYLRSDYGQGDGPVLNARISEYYANAGTYAVHLEQGDGAGSGGVMSNVDLIGGWINGVDSHGIYIDCKDTRANNIRMAWYRVEVPAAYGGTHMIYTVENASGGLDVLALDHVSCSGTPRPDVKCHRTQRVSVHATRAIGDIEGLASSYEIDVDDTSFLEAVDGAAWDNGGGGRLKHLYGSHMFRGD